MLYLEDFHAGQTFDLGPRTVTEAEIIAFARQFDPQPFHVDPAAARRSPYGGIIASGWHTIGVAMRMMVDGYIGKAASMGSPGVDRVRWLNPVRPGDTLKLRGTVREVLPSRSKPDRGMVRTEYEMTNQAGETVMAMTGLGMIGRRPQRG